MSPVDDLILNLITTQRPATSEVLANIITHVAQAPFATYQVRIPTGLRQIFNQHGVEVPAQLPSHELHLLKRIHLEQQWPSGTTTNQYISDLHQAVRHPDTQVWTYRYFTQPFIGFLAPSHVQNSDKPETYIFVVYSPTYRTITTGYQASRVEQVFTLGFTDLLKHK